MVFGIEVGLACRHHDYDFGSAARTLVSMPKRLGLRVWTGRPALHTAPCRPIDHDSWVLGEEHFPPRPINCFSDRVLYERAVLGFFAVAVKYEHGTEGVNKLATALAIEGSVYVDDLLKYIGTEVFPDLKDANFTLALELFAQANNDSEINRAIAWFLRDIARGESVPPQTHVTFGQAERQLLEHRRIRITGPALTDQELIRLLTRTDKPLTITALGLKDRSIFSVPVHLRVCRGMPLPTCQKTSGKIREIMAGNSRGEFNLRWEGYYWRVGGPEKVFAPLWIEVTAAPEPREIVEQT